MKQLEKMEMGKVKKKYVIGIVLASFLVMSVFVSTITADHERTWERVKWGQNLSE